MAKAKETNLNMDALESKLSDLKKEGMNLRFQHGAGQLQKTHLIRANKREVARVKTALNKKGE
jgi:large subunit ribosomal protein L29